MPLGDKAQMSRTIRIDLIPDVAVERARDRKKGIVVTAGTARQSRAQARTSAPGIGEVSRYYYHELLQSVYDATLITDMQGRIVDANVRALEFLQQERQRLCTLSLFDVIYSADEALLDNLKRNLENERFSLIQAYCLRHDGSFFPAEIAVNRLQFGEMHLCFFIRDITLRRQAEEMLRTEHNAIQNAGNGIAVADRAGVLEYVNPAAARMWRYEGVEGLVGRSVRDLFETSLDVSAMITAPLERGENWQGELRARAGDGAGFDAQVSAVCNRNADGEIAGIVFSFVDISDRKRADAAMRESERQRVMLESLGGACHHLSQPATVLLANLGLIHRRLDAPNEPLRDLLKISVQAAEELARILHRLNCVNEYKTTRYLDADAAQTKPESRIIAI